MLSTFYMQSYWVYIICSKRNGTLYTGVTNNLPQRIYQHREKLTEGFTKKYGITKLVHAEQFSSIYEAITREKALKKWRRDWKIKLIESHNPGWMDLYDTMP